MEYPTFPTANEGLDWVFSNNNLTLSSTEWVPADWWGINWQVPSSEAVPSSSATEVYQPNPPGDSGANYSRNYLNASRPNVWSTGASDLPRPQLLLSPSPSTSRYVWSDQNVSLRSQNVYGSTADIQLQRPEPQRKRQRIVSADPPLGLGGDACAPGGYDMPVFTHCVNGIWAPPPYPPPPMLQHTSAADLRHHSQKKRKRELEQTLQDTGGVYLHDLHHSTSLPVAHRSADTSGLWVFPSSPLVYSPNLGHENAVASSSRVQLPHLWSIEEGADWAPKIPSVSVVDPSTTRLIFADGKWSRLGTLTSRKGKGKENAPHTPVTTQSNRRFGDTTVLSKADRKELYKLIPSEYCTMRRDLAEASFRCRYGNCTAMVPYPHARDHYKNTQVHNFADRSTSVRAAAPCEWVGCALRHDVCQNSILRHVVGSHVGLYYECGADGCFEENKRPFELRKHFVDAHPHLLLPSPYVLVFQ